MMKKRMMEWMQVFPDGMFYRIYVWIEVLACPGGRDKKKPRMTVWKDGRRW